MSGLELLICQCCSRIYLHHTVCSFLGWMEERQKKKKKEREKKHIAVFQPLWLRVGASAGEARVCVRRAHEATVNTASCHNNDRVGSILFF